VAERPLDPDAQLMLRLQRGDEAALRQLLERNGRRVLNLAYRYLGDVAKAEDVVQETFLRIYKARDRYRPDAPFHAYMLRIATNLCLSQLRKKRSVSLDQPHDAEGRPRELEDADAAEPGTGLETRELHQRVRAAVQQLPERQRMAIVLNKFEGLDYQGVAEQLGLSVPATKSLLHRARMALKEVLAGYLEETG
jgi:RNA polymerase sigma-70 factor (ECF subfamily)